MQDETGGGDGRFEQNEGYGLWVKKKESEGEREEGECVGFGRWRGLWVCEVLAGEWMGRGRRGVEGEGAMG